MHSSCYALLACCSSPAVSASFQASGADQAATAAAMMAMGGPASLRLVLCGAVLPYASSAEVVLTKGSSPHSASKLGCHAALMLLSFHLHLIIVWHVSLHLCIISNSVLTARAGNVRLSLLAPSASQACSATSVPASRAVGGQDRWCCSTPPG